MKILVLVVVLSTSGAVPLFAQTPSTATQAAPKVCTLKVTGMTCAGCEAAVKIAVKRIVGVSAVTVSYDKALAQVTYDPAKTTPEAIAKIIKEKTGYKAEVPTSLRHE